MMSAVKVAHVTTISDSLEVLLGDQLTAIHRHGHAVTGISSAAGRLDDLSRRGIPHLAVPFVRSSAPTPTADLRVIGALVHLFRAERFTIVHTHTAKADLFAAIAARIARVPIVVTTLHGLLFDEYTPRHHRFLFAQAARIGMRMADAVLSQNSEDVETALRDRLCDPAKISCLGNGIDLERFSAERSSMAAARACRASLGLSEDALVVGYVGRMTAEKGVRDLLQAFTQVRREVPRARLLLVGPRDVDKADAVGPAEADALGIGDACVFTGTRHDVDVLYAAMDLVVLASHREGFPRTLMEASAMGRAAVATDIRGCRTAIEDGRSGLLVPVRSPTALAAAISRVLLDAGLRERLGRAGVEIARARFDQRDVFARVLETYERLLADRARAGGRA